MSAGHHSLRRARQQAGFTIIEALVALAILAGVLALVHQTLASGWGAVRRIELESKAVATARARLETVGTELALREGMIAGHDDGMRWRVDVTPYARPGETIVTPRLTAWWIRVEVAWQAPPFASERVVVLTTVKLAGPSP